MSRTLWNMVTKLVSKKLSFYYEVNNNNVSKTRFYFSSHKTTNELSDQAYFK